MQKRIELSCIRGDGASWRVWLTDSAGAKVDLTNFEIAFSGKLDIDDVDYVFQHDRVDGGVELIAGNLEARIKVLKEDTENLTDEYTVLQIDVEFIDPGFDPLTPLGGTLTVAADVTR